MLAEVETIGRPSFDTSCLQKSIIGMRMPTVPSSATVLKARQRRSDFILPFSPATASGYMIVIGLSLTSISWTAISGISLT